MVMEVKRVIGRMECLKCGHPTQVEGYYVPQVLDMLKDYRKAGCHECGFKHDVPAMGFTEPRVEIVAIKK